MHFVARIVVEKVDYGGRLPSGSTRNKAMIANIAVSGPDLESLKSKAAAHLDLVEDGGDINERATR